jgi:hypothetical protein
VAVPTQPGTEGELVRDRDHAAHEQAGGLGPMA